MDGDGDPELDAALVVLEIAVNSAFLETGWAIFAIISYSEVRSRFNNHTRLVTIVVLPYGDMMAISFDLVFHIIQRIRGREWAQATQYMPSAKMRRSC